MRKVRVSPLALVLGGLSVAEVLLMLWLIDTVRTLALGLVVLCAMASMF